MLMAFSQEYKKAPRRISWLAGANSRYGFWGIFDRIFPADRFLRLYIIQGGPGTGKSSLMKAVAKALEEDAESSVEYYYCSSDPNSLDGVILTKKGRRIGLLDGTMPHPRQLTHPGYTENLINLGEFWNEEKLCENKDTIKRLEKEKKDAYYAAYAALEILGKAEEEKLRLLKDAFLSEKAKKAAQRLVKSLSPLPPCATGEAPLRYRKALGMTGEVTLPTVEQLAKRIWLLEDHYGGAELFFRTLIPVLESARIGYIRCPSPTDPATTDCLLLAGGLAILREASENRLVEKRIRAHRFLDEKRLALRRPHLRAMEKIAEKEKKRALSLLRTAGVAHFSLEEIYKTAMDFSRKEEFSEQLTKEILFLLNMGEK